MIHGGIMSCAILNYIICSKTHILKHENFENKVPQLHNQLFAAVVIA